MSDQLQFPSFTLLFSIALALLLFSALLHRGLRLGLGSWWRGLDFHPLSFARDPELLPRREAELAAPSRGSPRSSAAHSEKKEGHGHRSSPHVEHLVAKAHGRKSRKA